MIEANDPTIFTLFDRGNWTKKPKDQIADLRVCAGGEHVDFRLQWKARKPNHWHRVASVEIMQPEGVSKRLDLFNYGTLSKMLQKSARMSATWIGYACRTGFRIYAHPHWNLQPALILNNNFSIQNNKNGDSIHEIR